MKPLGFVAIITTNCEKVYLFLFYKSSLDVKKIPTS